MKRDGEQQGGTDDGRTPLQCKCVGACTCDLQPLQGARIDARTEQVGSAALRASRERWGLWLLSTLRALSIPGHKFAAWLGVSESIVRRLFTGEKPLTAAHLEVAPDEVAEEFLRAFVVAKWGPTRAVLVLGRVMGGVASSTARGPGGKS